MLRSRKKIEVAGWIIFAVSIALLAIRLSHYIFSAPVAESRKMPPPPKSSGAWWFTGEPAPVGQAADLTGVWFGDPLGDISKATLPGQEMILTPLGKHRYDTVDHSLNPTNRCLPPGPIRISLMQLPMMIVQRPDLVLFLTEYQRTYRIVYTDGRMHDPDAKDYPDWMGSSIGHWEKDTLVMDTIGLNDRSWMDVNGHEHSAQLHITERYRLSEPNILEQLATFEIRYFL